MKLKKYLKSNKITSPYYNKLKKVKDEYVLNSRVKYNGSFFDRSSGKKYLCIVLAGYKDFLYPSVFFRLSNYMDDRIDVCIVSSGLYSDELAKICETNNWSYLSTKENNVSLVQNVAIKLHPNAKYIFKLDEDIFITKDYFAHMIEEYDNLKDCDYYPGVLAPIIPINAYGYMRVLEKNNLKKYYSDKFETPKYAASAKYMIENSSDVAKFFWGEGGYVPSIDELNTMFWEDVHEVRPCPIRFSIGAILFERKLWEDMGYFKVDRRNTALGADETQLCTYCHIHSRPIMVSENIVVGHLGFGKQNAEMKEYYLKNTEKFSI